MAVTSTAVGNRKQKIQVGGLAFSFGLRVFSG